MKKRGSCGSFISSFFVVVIVVILLAAFGLMGYNQYITNTRIQDALDCIVSDYNEQGVAGSSDEENDHSSPEDQQGAGVSNRLELSSAIAYLSKIQEVASNNNTAALLSLIYALITSLILSYGAKLLRLGESDKQKLAEEIKEKCQEDLNRVKDQLLLQTHISNVIVATNATIVSFQTLKIALLQNEQDDLESINKTFLDSLNTLLSELISLKKNCAPNQMVGSDFKSLMVVYSLFKKHYEEYTSISLPKEINDMEAVKNKADEIGTYFNEINKWQQRKKG